MIAKGRFKLIVSIAAIACVLGVLFVFGFVGNTAVRVRREHGLLLPPSASHFVCRGNALIPVLDRVAVSTFEIARADLASFTNQLKMRKPDALSDLWSHYSATNIAKYYCESPTGDFLLVDLWSIDDSRVGVRLYTDWN